MMALTNHMREVMRQIVKALIRLDQLRMKKTKRFHFIILKFVSTIN